MFTHTVNDFIDNQGGGKGAKGGGQGGRGARGTGGEGGRRGGKGGGWGERERYSHNRGCCTIGSLACAQAVALRGAPTTACDVTRFTHLVTHLVMHLVTSHYVTPSLHLATCRPST